jgi:hypothetical protein
MTSNYTQKWSGNCESKIILLENELKERESAIADETKAFGMEFLQTLLACGIPWNEVDGRLRRYIEEILEGPIDQYSNIKREFILKLLLMDMDMDNFAVKL